MKAVSAVSVEKEKRLPVAKKSKKQPHTQTKANSGSKERRRSRGTDAAADDSAATTAVIWATCASSPSSLEGSLTTTTLPSTATAAPKQREDADDGREQRHSSRPMMLSMYTSRGGYRDSGSSVQWQQAAAKLTGVKYVTTMFARLLPTSEDASEGTSEGSDHRLITSNNP